jgi:hypothetical protein
MAVTLTLQVVENDVRRTTRGVLHDDVTTADEPSITRAISHLMLTGLCAYRHVRVTIERGAREPLISAIGTGEKDHHSPGCAPVCAGSSATASQDLAQKLIAKDIRTSGSCLYRVGVASAHFVHASVWSRTLLLSLHGRSRPPLLIGYQTELPVGRTAAQSSGLPEVLPRFSGPRVFRPEPWTANAANRPIAAPARADRKIFRLTIIDTRIN